MDVTLLGTGGMMPLPGRFLTSLYVRCGSKAVLIDCGEGTQTAIRVAGLRFMPIDAIAITHFHADHISGLPGLLLTIGNEGRTEPLHMYGPEGLEQIVAGLRAIVPELPYAMEFHEYSQEGQFACAGMTVDVFPVDHTVPCLAYGFTVDRAGKFDPEAAKKKGIPTHLWGRLQKGECVDGFSPADVLGAPRKGIRLVYATDTRPVSAIAKQAEGADLLILEGMFGEEAKQERAEFTHHMMMHEAAKIAAEAGAKELWLTHYSPATPEPALYAEALRGIFPNTVLPADGKSATLKFTD